MNGLNNKFETLNFASDNSKTEMSNQPYSTGDNIQSTEEMPQHSESVNSNFMNTSKGTARQMIHTTVSSHSGEDIEQHSF